MPIDNTSLFKTCVKTVKTGNQIFGTQNGGIHPILKRSNTNQFIIKSSELVKQITHLRDFILQHRKAYLNFTPSFVSTDQMTDEERDNIDANSQSIIKSSWQLIGVLKSYLKSTNMTIQATEVYQAIIDLIESYLKVVCKLITEQMTMRMKWKSELQKILKSDLENKCYELDTKTERFQNDTSIQKISPSYSSSDIGFEDVLSKEEMQVFELENELLYNDLNSLNEEVRAIQNKVVKIAELQEVFTEKVLEQNEDLERITTTLVGTTENIKDANKQIREAIQNNAGLRIYLLFFLLVMSFSLLFLDWYND